MKEIKLFDVHLMVRAEMRGVVHAYLFDRTRMRIPRMEDNLTAAELSYETVSMPSLLWKTLERVNEARETIKNAIDTATNVKHPDDVYLAMREITSMLMKLERRMRG